jgi:uncharacterized protein (TIGR02646 family)
VKRVLKSAEPQALAAFRTANPNATWEQMRDDALGHGRQAYQDCRAQAMSDQHGLCAYCESKLDPAKPHKCRVEHVRPKSHTATWHNLALDWHNLLAVCNGGETEGSIATPLPANLSCDAHKKDSTIEVSPLEIPAFPNVFAFDKATGHLMPDHAACAKVNIAPDKLERSMETLNLNCARLARLRRSVLFDMERRKKTLRGKRHTAQSGAPLLADGYFKNTWPEFFSTIRCCLGQAAEDSLHSINYCG